VALSIIESNNWSPDDQEMSC